MLLFCLFLQGGPKTAAALWTLISSVKTFRHEKWMKHEQKEAEKKKQLSHVACADENERKGQFRVQTVNTTKIQPEFKRILKLMWSCCWSVKTFCYQSSDKWCSALQRHAKKSKHRKSTNLNWSSNLVQNKHNCKIQLSFQSSASTSDC